jgi:hypothetical protein
MTSDPFRGGPLQYLEEVSSGQDVHVSGDKILPRSRLASLRSRSNVVASHNVSHRLIRQAVTQIGQRSDRCGHIPSQYSHAPFAPPKLPRTVQPRGGLDTVVIWNHRTSYRRAFDTRLGWCQAWRCRNISERFASHTAPDLGQSGALGITQPQSRLAASPQNTVLPRPDIHSAGEAPDSPNLSRTLAVATTSCPS